jgi:hypothetical protein
MRKALLPLTAAIFFSVAGQGQTDTELWTGGEIRYRITNKWSTQAEQVFKFNDTISHFKSAFTELSAKYRITDFFFPRCELQVY